MIFLTLFSHYRFVSFVVAHFTTSQRGKPACIFRGHRYNFASSNGLKSRWRCANQQKFMCVAFIVTVGKDVVRHRNKHNHLCSIKKNYQNAINVMLVIVITKVICKNNFIIAHLQFLISYKKLLNFPIAYHTRFNHINISYVRKQVYRYCDFQSMQ